MTEPLTAPCTVPECSGQADWGRGWAVCFRHGIRAGEMLARLGTEFELLSAAPALGQRKEGEAVSGGALKSERSPVNLDAVVARDRRSREQDAADPDGNAAPAVLAWVLGCAELVRLQRPVDMAPAASFAQARTRLSASLDWVLACEWAGDFVAALRVHFRALTRLNSSVQPPRRSACRGCGTVGSLSWDGERASCAACQGSWSGLAVLRPSGTA